MGVMTAQHIIDTWVARVEREFGSGWQAAALRSEAAGLVAALLSGPNEADSAVGAFGQRLGEQQLDLGTVTSFVDLLIRSAPRRVAAPLRTKRAAVALADGWHAGCLAVVPATTALLTPWPVFVEMVRHASGRSTGLRLVVVDVQQLRYSPAQRAVARDAIVTVLRRVFRAGQPVAEGGNGNLVVLVERDELSAARLAELQAALRDVTTESAVPQAVDALRVWVEPLGTAAVHLEAHLDGIIEGDPAPPTATDDGPRRGGGPAPSSPSKRPRSGQGRAALRRHRPT